MEVCQFHKEQEIDEIIKARRLGHLERISDCHVVKTVWRKLEDKGVRERPRMR